MCKELHFEVLGQTMILNVISKCLINNIPAGLHLSIFTKKWRFAVQIVGRHAVSTIFQLKLMFYTKASFSSEYKDEEDYEMVLFCMLGKKELWTIH